MRAPQFTAETSLPRVSEEYQAAMTQKTQTSVTPSSNGSWGPPGPSPVGPRPGWGAYCDYATSTMWCLTYSRRTGQLFYDICGSCGPITWQ